MENHQTDNRNAVPAGGATVPGRESPGAAPPDVVRGVSLKAWAVRILVGVALPWILVAIVFRTLPVAPLVLGSVWASLNALAASAIHRRAIASRGTAFLAWSLGGNGARMVLFLGGILTGCLCWTEPGPFLVAVLGAFAILHTIEIASMHKSAVSEMRRRKIQP